MYGSPANGGGTTTTMNMLMAIGQSLKVVIMCGSRVTGSINMVVGFGYPVIGDNREFKNQKSKLKAVQL